MHIPSPPPSPGVNVRDASWLRGVCVLATYLPQLQQVGVGNRLPAPPPAVRQQALEEAHLDGPHDPGAADQRARGAAEKAGSMSMMAAAARCEKLRRLAGRQDEVPAPA